MERVERSFADLEYESKKRVTVCVHQPPHTGFTGSQA